MDYRLNSMLLFCGFWNAVCDVSGFGYVVYGLCFLPVGSILCVWLLVLIFVIILLCFIIYLCVCICVCFFADFGFVVIVLVVC